MKTDLYIATLPDSIATLYRVHPHRRTEIHSMLSACIKQADANAKLDSAPTLRPVSAKKARK